MRPFLRGTLVTAAGLAAALVAAPRRAAAQDQPTALNPHVTLRGLACTACHTTQNWRDVLFDHRTTGTPLRGQHASAPCTGCHNLRDFRTVARECRTCHQDPHRGDAGLRCEQCHSEASWQQVSARDAHARTRLPELGVHASLKCVDCHRQASFQQFSGAVTPCVACHQATYAATTSPAHATMGFSSQCESCHQFTTWNFALYRQHDAIFGIYTGAHAGNWRNCASCHTSGSDYAVFSCTVCHAQARTDAQHSSLGGAYSYQSSACLMCHPNGSRGSFAQHDAVFPIFSGAHQGTWTTCAACHPSGGSSATFTCMSSGCHPQAVTDPIHSGITGYAFVATQCLSCHPAGGPANFTQHDALFPIYSGTHRSVWTACTACHPTAGQPSQFTCMSSGCHAQAATDPIHSGITGYSYTAAQCLSCHPTGQPASFTQHDALYFPIYSGTHAGTWSACTACHPTAGTPNLFTCMSSGCHAQAATDPIHTGIAGYSYVAAQCLSCHPTGQQASFTQHDALFPIYSGTHAGTWSACTACHPTAGSPNLFTCMSSGCHAQAATDPIHAGITGYSYTASQCLSCHPTGLQANFTQHDALYFPIYSGNHAGVWSACTSCHPTAGSPNVFTCMSSGCHVQAATDPLHTGITGYSYAASQCYSCHPTGAQGNFPQHDALYFPIYSGRHNGVWTTCTQCHPTAGTPSVFTCMSGSCHPQAQTDANHAGRTGYSYTPAACLSCHPRGTSG